MNGKANSQITDTLKFINKILEDLLNSKIGGKKFTGHINIDINCTDGGITNTNGEIKQIIKK